MPEEFLISDTHFGQESILTFKRWDGTPLRSFSTVEEMDEYIVDRWNETVADQDKIYHLGDVVFKNKNADILGRLKGQKILIKGNHDLLKPGRYLEYFKDVRAYKIWNQHGIIASHIPIHPECLSRWKLNIHGHLHANTLDDPRYFNVSVEQIDYRPINLKQIVQDLTG